MLKQNFEPELITFKIRSGQKSGPDRKTGMSGYSLRKI